MDGDFYDKNGSPMDPNRDGVIHDKDGNSISIAYDKDVEDGNVPPDVMLVDKLELPALELASNLKGEKSVMKQLQDLAYSMAFNSTLDNDKFPTHPDRKTNIEDLKIIREDVEEREITSPLGDVTSTYIMSPATLSSMVNSMPLSKMAYPSSMEKLMFMHVPVLKVPHGVHVQADAQAAQEEAEKSCLGMKYMSTCNGERKPYKK